MTPDEIITEIEQSGLRGRGGAGFPTGRKWRRLRATTYSRNMWSATATRATPARSWIDLSWRATLTVCLEGMAICALAISAEEGFLYIRDEYDMAVQAINAAIHQAEEAGIWATI